MEVKIGDFGSARSLPESLSEKSSGNTATARNSIGKGRFDPEILRNDLRDVFLEEMADIAESSSKKGKSVSNLIS